MCPVLLSFAAQRLPTAKFRYSFRGTRFENTPGGTRTRNLRMRSPTPSLSIGPQGRSEHFVGARSRSAAAVLPRTAWVAVPAACFGVGVWQGSALECPVLSHHFGTVALARLMVVAARGVRVAHGLLRSGFQALVAQSEHRRAATNARFAVVVVAVIVVVVCLCVAVLFLCAVPFAAVHCSPAAAFRSCLAARGARCLRKLLTGLGLPRLAFAGLACFPARAMCSGAAVPHSLRKSARAALVCCAIRCGSASFAAGVRRVVRRRRPHRLVVRTSRRGRDNPGSTPGVDSSLAFSEHCGAQPLPPAAWRQTLSAWLNPQVGHREA